MTQRVILKYTFIVKLWSCIHIIDNILLILFQADGTLTKQNIKKIVENREYRKVPLSQGHKRHFLGAWIH